MKQFSPLSRQVNIHNPQCLVAYVKARQSLSSNRSHATGAVLLCPQIAYSISRLDFAEATADARSLVPQHECIVCGGAGRLQVF
jgi:hypothetical protein